MMLLYITLCRRKYLIMPTKFLLVVNEELDLSALPVSCVVIQDVNVMLRYHCLLTR